MTAAFWLVLLLGVGCGALRAIGPLALGGRKLPRRLAFALEMLVPALLAAFVATQTLSAGRHLVLDAKAGGLVVALLLSLWGRSPIIVLLAAAGTTAAIRALGFAM